MEHRDYCPRHFHLLAPCRCGAEPEPASSCNSDVVSRRQHPGYRARNLDVATAYGLNAELCKTLDRMRKRGDCPLWLIESLCDCIQRSNALIGALRRYRDDLPEFLDG